MRSHGIKTVRCFDVVIKHDKHDRRLAGSRLKLNEKYADTKLTLQMWNMTNFFYCPGSSYALATKGKCKFKNYT